MAFVEDPPDQLRMALGPLANSEEGRDGAVLRQDVEHLRREDRVRSVVERQRDAALCGDRRVG